MTDIDKYWNVEEINTKNVILWGGGNYGNSALCFFHLHKCVSNLIICDKKWNDSEKLREKLALENRLKDLYQFEIKTEYTGQKNLKNIIGSRPEDFSVIIAVAKDETAAEICKECKAIGLYEKNIYRFVNETIDKVIPRIRNHEWGALKKKEILEDSAVCDRIRAVIEAGTPFLVSRWGGVEGVAQMQYMNGCLTEHSIYALTNNAGVFPSEDVKFLKKYFSVMADAARQIDFYVCGPWNPYFEEMWNLLSSDSIRMVHYLLPPLERNDFYLSALAGKKILVIHPFASLIETQYQKRQHLWKQKNVLPEWDLQTYATVQSIGGSDEYANWIEALNRMQDDISKIDFDCALIAGGAYGMPLGAFIKTNLKKQAIHVGGQLQLLFGIKGRRWDESIVASFYNDYWVRPPESFKPQNWLRVDNGSYW